MTVTTILGNTAEEAYANGVFREVVRLLARRRPHDGDDIAAEVTATVLEGPDAIMAKYADPQRYARVVVRHASIAFDRHERAQRGEGVRLVKGPDGRLAPRRRAISGSMCLGGEHDGPELMDTIHRGGESFADVVDKDLDDAALLARCLVGIPSVDRELLFLVDGMGYSVLELADRFGQVRETVSRRVNRTRRLVQQNRVAMAMSASDVTM